MKGVIKIRDVLISKLAHAWGARKSENTHEKSPF